MLLTTFNGLLKNGQKIFKFLAWINQSQSHLQWAHFNSTSIFRYTKSYKTIFWYVHTWVLFEANSFAFSTVSSKHQVRVSPRRLGHVHIKTIIISSGIPLDNEILNKDWQQSILVLLGPNLVTYFHQKNMYTYAIVIFFHKNKKVVNRNN